MDKQTQFKIGDLAKIIEENRVFLVAAITTDALETVPAGWLMSSEGLFVNPKLCKLYEGAVSVLKEVETNG